MATRPERLLVALRTPNASRSKLQSLAARNNMVMLPVLPGLRLLIVDGSLTPVHVPRRVYPAVTEEGHSSNLDALSSDATTLISHQRSLAQLAS
jgi:hypothetical protein